MLYVAHGHYLVNVATADLELPIQVTWWYLTDIATGPISKPPMPNVEAKIKDILLCASPISSRHKLLSCP